MADSFYLTLHSNKSLLIEPLNTINSFKSHLGHVMHLQGSWEVGIAELHYPMTMPNINDPYNIIQSVGNSKKTNYYIPPAYYTNSFSLIEKLGNILRSEMSFEMSDDGRTEIHYTMESIRDGRIYSIPKIIARQLGYTEKSIFNAIEAKIFAMNAPDIKRGLPQQLYVHCNLIKHQISGEAEFDLLRIVPTNLSTYIYGCEATVSFNRIHYIPLVNNTIEMVQIHIKDSTGRLISFTSGSSTVVLHFKRVS